MSNYNKMRGEYTLTASDIKKVHTYMRRAIKTYQEKLYLESVALFKKLGGSAGVRKAIKEGGLYRSSLNSDAVEVVIAADGYQPKKKDVVVPYTSASTCFSNDYGSISFDGDEISVYVDENNRGVESFENTIEFGSLMTALRSLKWSRKNTGGYLKYMDEYISDAMGEPSIVHGFGHIHKDYMERKWREYFK